jgi:hypothetical protein
MIVVAEGASDMIGVWKYLPGVELARPPFSFYLHRERRIVVSLIVSRCSISMGSGLVGQSGIRKNGEPPSSGCGIEGVAEEIKFDEQT